MNAFRTRRTSESIGVINLLSTYECGAGKAHCDTTYGQTHRLLIIQDFDDCKSDGEWGLGAMTGGCVCFIPSLITIIQMYVGGDEG